MRVLAVSLVVASSVWISCGSSGDAGPPDAAIGADDTVTVFDGTHVYFGDGGSRVVDIDVTLPDAGLSYESITMHFALRCPNDRCDWWDRLGWIAAVENAGTDDEVVYELLRFITPYRVGGSWTADVTGMRPVLAGDVTLRVFIDTWVGPGHANGDGWLVDTSLELRGGVPVAEPFAVVPLTSGPEGVVYGDPASPTARAWTAPVPDGATRAVLRSFVTGHGQGNADNCAEFCSRQHWFDVAGERYARTVWRDNCAETGVPNQQGTWTLSRAGWCPGDIVHAWSEEVTAQLLPAGEGPRDLSVTYDLDEYENTCRPDAETCAGCVFNTGCDYDGGAHTVPQFYVSSAVIFYR